MSFKKNKYAIIKKAISKELADFIYKYFLLKRDVAKFYFENKLISPYEKKFGYWFDEQIPNTYSHYSDIAMETLKGIEVKLKPGDMLVYRGCELEHWRTKFKGENCGQVFLHYNNKKTLGAEENKFDKRPMLGVII